MMSKKVYLPLSLLFSLNDDDNDDENKEKEKEKDKKDILNGDDFNDCF